MAKKYNLSKNLDMKHFERDITNKVHSIAEDAIASKIYEIECPHCHKKYLFQADSAIVQNAMNQSTLT